MTSKTNRSRSHRVETSLAVRALAEQNTVRAFERLLKLMSSENDCVAVAAAKIVLDRSCGKVPVLHGSAPGTRPRQPRTLQVKIAHLNPRSDADAR
ncbi:MAG TPA: hypothetical protein VFK21_00650 [Gammaproteobacteria bacterium]|nr:hypothetical protein [Gammaproteobacteria bacterium]